ncbi:MAG TPA: cytochrome ubiquinol oxidase subunit I [Thermoanaerobaculia bacterium]|nr:cytochrome ubiquinol oxidase subunit I [Thermoanaerobaculia bacterium]
MDAVWLARLQFSLTVMFHFLFPPISIGLGFLVFLLETARWRTGRDVYRRASDFWLKLFAINFAVGVATGIVMEFEFGTNWAGYSRFVGDIFGAPLAAEGVFAFFLESGFLGLLLLGRKRISSFVRWFAAAMVSLGTVLSAFWILVANSWMQTPDGYRVEGGRALLTDFGAAVFNPSTLPRFAHTLSASLCMGAFLMAGICSWLYLKGRGSDAARVSLRLAVVAAFAGCAFVFVSGDRHARQVAHTQQAKFAAMEGLYSTQKGAPLILFSLPPTQQGPREGPEIVITNLTSALAFGNFQAPIRGLQDFPADQWPPVAVTFLSFHNMVIVGNLMALVALAGLVLLLARKLETARWWQRVAIAAVPLPMIAIQLGWTTAEVGRQPWIVYGLLRTKDAVSKVVAAPAILFSIILFSAIYLCLGGLWLFLLGREIAHGPDIGTRPDAAGEDRHVA